MSFKHLNGAGIYGSKSTKLWDQTTVQNDFQSIATVVVPAAGQSSVTFSNIPQNYTHLQLRVTARSSRSDQNGSFFELQVGNSSADAGANYFWHFMNGNGTSTVSALGRATQNWIEVDRYATAADSAGVFGSVIIDVLDYANVTKNKTVKYLGGYDTNSAGEVYFGSGAWNNYNTAINTITLTEGSGSFAQFSQFALYGIKAAS